MNFRGLKVACFLAFPGQARFFLPIREELRRHGGDILFITPLAEYPYEIEMMRRKLNFRYFTDYMTGEVIARVDAGLSGLFEKWAAICFKWKGFSRWPVFLQTWLIKETVTEYFCMEKFIESERPDMFLIHHECGRWGKIIGHLCFKNSVPMVTFQEGDYYSFQTGSSLHTEFSTANLLWGNVTKKRLADFKCSTDKMFPVGSTHIEGAVKEYFKPEVIAGTRKELALPPGKKIVLFLVGVMYGGIVDESVWRLFLNSLEPVGKEAVLIFKWHPNVMRGTIEAIKSKFREFCPSAIFLDSFDPYRLIAVSDYCVSLGQTTMTVEAIAFGKPIFSVPDPGATADYYVDMGVAQSVFPPGNWTNLVNTMNNGVPADIQARTGKFLEDNFFKLDGRAVERTVDIISYILKVRKNKQQAKAAGSEQFEAGKEKTKPNMKGRVSFIVPSGGDPEALLATLTSLSDNVKHPDWETVIVVSDKSIKGMLSGISGDIRIVEAEGGLARLYNAGAAVSSGEYLVFLRPGIVYFKDEGVVNAMEEGIAGFPVKNKDMSAYCMGVGFDFNSTPYFIKKDLATDDKRNAVGGGLIAMKKEFFVTLGGFDDAIANHLAEADMCMNAREAGIPIKYLHDCLAFNYKETFFGEDVSDENWKNRVRFFTKWVGRLPKDEDFLSFAGDILKV